MKNSNARRWIGGLFLLSALGAVGQNLLLNPNFDLTPQGVNWTCVNGAGVRPRYNSGGHPTMPIRGGSGYSLEVVLQSPAPNPLPESVYAFQAYAGAVSPGERWTFSGYALNWDGSPIMQPGNYAVLQLVFTGPGMTNIFESEHMDNSATDWRFLTVTHEAPAGTTGVGFRASMVFANPTDVSTMGGAVYYDEMSATRISSVPEPACVGTMAVAILGLAACVVTSKPKLLVRHEPGTRQRRR